MWVGVPLGILKKLIMSINPEKNRKRNEEVAKNLLEMGKALLDEGHENGNVDLLNTGNMICLLSGLMVNTDKLNQFSDLASMFSAKEILDGMVKNPMGIIPHDIREIFDKLRGEGPNDEVE